MIRRCESEEQQRAGRRSMDGHGAAKAKLLYVPSLETRETLLYVHVRVLKVCL